MVSLTLHLLIKLIVRPCRSTQSLDPEALEGRLSKGGSRRAEYLNFRHFSSLFTLAHLLL